MKASYRARRARGWLGVPLIYRDEAIGVITLDNRMPGFYNEDDARGAMVFANQAAIAIENARLFEELDEWAKGLVRLQQVTATISAKPNNVEKVLHLIVDSLIDIFREASCVIWLYDSEEDEFRQWVAAGILKDQVVHLPRPGGTSRYLIRTRAPRYLEDTSIPPPDGGPAVNKEIVAQGVRAAAHLPLLSDVDVIGLLYLNLSAPHRFSQNEKGILELFTPQAAIAVENARLYEQRVKDIAALQEINRAVTTEEGRAGIADLIVQKAQELTQAEYVTLWMVADETKDRLAMGAVYGREAKVGELPINEHSINGWGTMTGEPYQCPGVSKDPHYLEWYEDVRSSITAPLKLDDKVNGTLPPAYAA